MGCFRIRGHFQKKMFDASLLKDSEVELDFYLTTVLTFPNPVYHIRKINQSISKLFSTIPLYLLFVQCRCVIPSFAMFSHWPQWYEVIVKYRGTDQDCGVLDRGRRPRSNAHSLDLVPRCLTDFKSSTKAEQFEHNTALPAVMSTCHSHWSQYWLVIVQRDITAAEWCANTMGSHCDWIWTCITLCHQVGLMLHSMGVKNNRTMPRERRWVWCNIHLVDTKM